MSPAYPTRFAGMLCPQCSAATFFMLENWKIKNTFLPYPRGRHLQCKPSMALEPSRSIAQVSLVVFEGGKYCISEQRVCVVPTFMTHFELREASGPITRQTAARQPILMKTDRARRRERRERWIFREKRNNSSPRVFPGKCSRKSPNGVIELGLFSATEVFNNESILDGGFFGIKLRFPISGSGTFKNSQLDSWNRRSFSVLSAFIELSII